MLGLFRVALPCEWMAEVRLAGKLSAISHRTTTLQETQRERMLFMLIFNCWRFRERLVLFAQALCH